MGVSLIAPVALLLAAVVVAAGGGGLGGLGSLGQISSGPTLPDTGLESTPRASLAEIQLPTAGLTGAAAGGTGGPGPTGGSAPGGGGGAPGPAGGPGGPRDGTPPIIGTPRTQSPAPRRPPTTPPSPAPPAPVPQSPAAAPPDPVGDVIETTRGLGESLPAPLGPTTGDIIDSLLGPGR